LLAYELLTPISNLVAFLSSESFEVYLFLLVMPLPLLLVSVLIYMISPLIELVLAGMVFADLFIMGLPLATVQQMLIANYFYDILVVATVILNTGMFRLIWNWTFTLDYEGGDPVLPRILSEDRGLFIFIDFLLAPEIIPGWILSQITIFIF